MFQRFVLILLIAACGSTPAVVPERSPSKAKLYTPPERMGRFSDEPEEVERFGDAVLLDRVPIRPISGRDRIGLATWGRDPRIRSLSLEVPKKRRGR